MLHATAAPVPSFATHGADAASLETWPAFERVYSGAPVQSGFLSTESPLMTGVWECEVGSFDVGFFFADKGEFSYFLEGKVKVTDEHGRSQVYGAGEGIMTAKGFKGTWEVLEPLRKVFAIYR